MRALLIVVIAVGACGKKSSPPSARDDAAEAAPSTRPAPSLPAEVHAGADAIDASIATHVTPPPATAFGHFCPKTDGTRSKCVTTEEECKRLAPRCGQWKSVFCFEQPAGAACFTSSADCKAARAEAATAGEQVTSECAQDEM